MMKLVYINYVILDVPSMMMIAMQNAIAMKIVMLIDAQMIVWIRNVLMNNG